MPPVNSIINFGDTALPDAEINRNMIIHRRTFQRLDNYTDIDLSCQHLTSTFVVKKPSSLFFHRVVGHLLGIPLIWIPTHSGVKQTKTTIQQHLHSQAFHHSTKIKDTDCPQITWNDTLWAYVQQDCEDLVPEWQDQTM